MSVSLSLGASLKALGTSRLGLRPSEPAIPVGYVLLVDDDGASLTDDDGAFFMEVI